MTETCLQCGESREAVKAERLYCATLTGYETPEVDEEWERHHWRDWSDAELERMGIHPTLREANRRTLAQDLQFVRGQSVCLTREQHVIDTTDMGPPDYVCVVCWGTITPAETTAAKRIETYDD